MFGQRIIQLVPSWVAEAAGNEPSSETAPATRRRLRAMRSTQRKQVQSTEVSDNRLRHDLLDQNRLEHMQWFQSLADDKKRLRQMRIENRDTHVQTLPDNCLSNEFDERVRHTHEIDQVAVEYWNTTGASAKMLYEFSPDQDDVDASGNRYTPLSEAECCSTANELACDPGDLESQLRTTDVAWLIAEDYNPEKRLQLARNVNCPLAVLELLETDENRRVALAARRMILRLMSGDRTSAVGTIEDWNLYPISNPSTNQTMNKPRPS